VLAQDDYERVGEMSKTTKGLVKAFVITVILLAGLVFLTGGSAAKLAIRAHGFLFPSYSRTLVAYYVSEGETVWDIANAHMKEQDKYRDCRELMFDIRKHNNLIGKELQAGQQIVIPLYKEI
jgi:hypothetical protein